MAFRMQTSVPELVDLSGESEETLAFWPRRLSARFAMPTSPLD